MSLTITLKKFVGGPYAALEWTPYLEHVQEVAVRTPTPNSSGLNLLGAVLTDAEWAACPLVIQRGLGPFEFIQHPGPVAEQPEDTYDARLKTNEILLRRYMLENNAVLEFTTAIIASLDETSRRHIADPGGGTAIMTRTLREIISMLTAKHAHVPPTHIGIVYARLHEPYLGGPVPPFFATQTETHRILALAGEPLADATKIRHAHKALTTGSGTLYVHAKDMYEEGCRTARDGAGNLAPIPMTWPQYTEAIIAASARIHEQDTTGTAGFAGAVMGPPTDTELHGHTQTTLATAIAAAVSAELAKHLPARKGGGAQARDRNPLPRQYCWTHGVCAHTGKECNAKGDGHIANATAKDKAGGSTKGERRAEKAT
ncbi:hypothetical protein B484DRAFT_400545 [Ochromonadaceae sp. CCMP2298]|jgi:hypothetical protein|nr:hypothetical protein B484DRAFT_400545 [Ochromonadaceae sp. CCMP2298]